jgi:hypothetical protein
VELVGSCLPCLGSSDANLQQGAIRAIHAACKMPMLARDRKSLQQMLLLHAVAVMDKGAEVGGGEEDRLLRTAQLTYTVVESTGLSIDNLTPEIEEPLQVRPSPTPLFACVPFHG